LKEETTDELLDGLKVRDFMVLVFYATGHNPRSVGSLLRLRRGPYFVRRAERRLASRGLLAIEDGDPTATRDGLRAARTGSVLFELENFYPRL
jgi:hypothetical protein